jgi:Tfp pilus assembly protein PilV
MKKGFGLLEVLIAAVVLGFLIIGLNRLQLGNREAVLRVRARDAANVIAQDIIDSYSAIGSASVEVGERWCNPDDEKLKDLCITRFFNDTKVEYSAKVIVTADEQNQKAGIEETDFIRSLSSSSGQSVSHQFAKQVDITVEWKFKDSPQSINVSSVIR